MLDNLSKKTISKIKKLLLSKQKEVEEQIKVIDRDDPVFDQNVEVSEPGTESWQAEVHGRISAVKGDLISMSKKITVSLLQLKKGTYGKCQSCGKPIEADRLEVIPTASLCMSCSKKAEFKLKPLH
ncbi:TraR/DksA family transcriptional regulator [Patescibacteria group bacterium]|nr:TraR/DksA family transcriptional regulator [Patescibacteria group bacterium]MCL5409691.1 TraR/DksA family transcriptional regulator [Patescibacteria group bacterium]